MLVGEHPSKKVISLAISRHISRDRFSERFRWSIICGSSVRVGSTSVDGSKPAISSTGKTGHFHAGDRDESVLLRGVVGAQVGLDLGTPASRSAFEDVGVM
jgi:hypothetical protein